MICNLHNRNRYLFFLALFSFDMNLSCSICNAGDANNHSLSRDNHFLFLSLKHGGRSSLPDGLVLVCLAYCRSAALSLLPGHLDRYPLPFPFWSVSRSTEHLPPFEHDLFDIQDGQSLPFSSAPFEEYAAAAALSLDGFFKVQKSGVHEESWSELREGEIQG